MIGYHVNNVPEVSTPSPLARGLRLFFSATRLLWDAVAPTPPVATPQREKIQTLPNELIIPYYNTVIIFIVIRQLVVSDSRL